MGAPLLCTHGMAGQSPQSPTTVPDRAHMADHVQLWCFQNSRELYRGVGHPILQLTERHKTHPSAINAPLFCHREQEEIKIFINLTPFPQYSVSYHLKSAPLAL